MEITDQPSPDNSRLIPLGQYDLYIRDKPAKDQRTIIAVAGWLCRGPPNKRHAPRQSPPLYKSQAWQILSLIYPSQNWGSHGAYAPQSPGAVIQSGGLMFPLSPP